MESYQIHREDAKKRLHTADHMLTQTYPLVNDPKMLISVLRNIHTALDLALSSFLEHERYFKRIPVYHDSFMTRLDLLRKISKRYGLEDAVRVIEKVDGKMRQHMDSPVEFSRKGQFMICNKKYDVQTLSVPELKGYIKTSKVIIGKIDEITIKNERILDRFKTGNKKG